MDLGCGQGVSACFLSNYGFKIVAVDGSISAILKLQKCVVENRVGNIQVLHSDISKIDYPDCYFDVVLDIGAICCNENYSDIFDEVSRLLKTNGYFISVLPADDTTDDQLVDRGKVVYFNLTMIKECLDGKFEMNLFHKCVEDIGRKRRMSHWLVEGFRH